MGCTFQPEPPPLPPLSMCPFCGSNPVRIQVVMRVSEAERAVLCACGARGPLRETEAEAVMFWNERRF